MAIVQGFLDSASGTISYFVADRPGGRAAIIDPVLDFDVRSGAISTRLADQLLDYLRAQSLGVDWILETHVHADHLTAAAYLRANTGARVAISARVCEVQRHFAAQLDLQENLQIDGSQFDVLVQDGDRLPLGELYVQALAVPGHTPADIAWHIGDYVFVGDSIFMPDVGTARCDFPGGSARQLYASLRRLLALPPATKLMICHDYPPVGRSAAWQTTVAEQRARNIHAREGVTEAEFIALRETRDASLAVPALLYPALQVNLRAGRLPPANARGARYLQLPLQPPPAATWV
jgi:glyoxylase-like metal-dependent hydrolase (beta-lactamase superfamily II)